MDLKSSKTNNKACVFGVDNNYSWRNSDDVVYVKFIEIYYVVIPVYLSAILRIYFVICKLYAWSIIKTIIGVGNYT